MILHLLKLVWNRKGSNALIILEIFLCFLVIFAVATTSLHLFANYRSPLGYEWQDVWRLDVEDDGRWNAEDATTLEQLLRELERLPTVEAASATAGSPYGIEREEISLDAKGRNLSVEYDRVTLDLGEVLDLELVEGRWFEESDTALAWNPVVINLQLARAVFGEEEPIGERLRYPDGREAGRVVGVVSAFRRQGELVQGAPFLFHLRRIEDTTQGSPRHVLLRLRSGSTAEVEEELLRVGRSVARNWTMDLEPLATARESAFQLRLLPLWFGGIVAAFLMVMVGLGLSGVMWQNVTRRRREIGLRRATGATASEVRWQIVLELLLITAFGQLLGTVVVLQLPLLDLVGPMDPMVWSTGLLSTLLLLTLLAILCGLYPSWIATRIEPAEALRDE